MKITLEHEGAHNFLQDMYLDWVNNFLTVERFAEYYRITPPQAIAIIELGRKAHEEILKEQAA